MILVSDSDESRSELERLLTMLKKAGLSDKRVASLGLGLADNEEKPKSK